MDETEKKKNIGQLIKRRREDLQYTQEELASLLEMGLSTVQTWESGVATPNPPSLRKIAKVLDIPIQAFSSAPAIEFNVPSLSEDIKELRMGLEWKFKEVENLTIRLASSSFAGEKFARFYMKDELFRDLVDKWEMFSESDRLTIKTVVYTPETLLSQAKALRNASRVKGSR